MSFLILFNAKIYNNVPVKYNFTQLKLRKVLHQPRNSSKNGCEVEKVSGLVKYILENCKNLEFMGIMTIGVYGYDVSKGPNPDFLCLKKCREDLCKELDLDVKKVELSMGMSTDYEHAVEMGSTNIRVGTAIFGERPKKDT